MVREIPTHLVGFLRTFCTKSPLSVNARVPHSASLLLPVQRVIRRRKRPYDAIYPMCGWLDGQAQEDCRFPRRITRMPGNGANHPARVSSRGPPVHDHTPIRGSRASSEGSAQTSPRENAGNDGHQWLHRSARCQPPELPGNFRVDLVCQQVAAEGEDQQLAQPGQNNQPTICRMVRSDRSVRSKATARTAVATASAP